MRLLQGDCLDIMSKLAEEKVKVNAVITDLPYGTTNCSWDTPIDLNIMWERLKAITNDNTPMVLFAQTPFDKVLGASNLQMLRYEWILEKTSATGHLNAKKMPMKAHENILVFYKKLPTYNPQKTDGHNPVNSFTKTLKNQEADIYGKCNQVIVGGGNTDRYPRSVLKGASDKQKLKLHQTQKPLWLLEYLVKTYTNEGDTVLDFTMGSGTAGEACKNLNREFIGIELEQEIFNIANERISS